MKASDFKNIIKEAVREVIREELLEVVQQPMQENVKSAQPVVYEKTGNAIDDILAETRATMTRDEYKNIINADSSMAQSFNRLGAFGRQNTAPSSDDPAIVQRAVQMAPKTGLDLSQLGFVNKAAAILNTSNEKDKLKHGV